MRAEGLEEPGVGGLGVKRRFRAQARPNERVNLAGMEKERERAIEREKRKRYRDIYI